MVALNQKQYEHLLTVANNCTQWRLDKLVSLLLPEMSLRGRRRLIEQGFVEVDGEKKRPGYRVYSGQTVGILPIRLLNSETPRILARTNGFVALYKPGGLHTAELAGGGEDSLEGRMRRSGETADLLLLNRLDQPTSGIVMAAESKADALRYKKFEAVGQIKKIYYAMVIGLVEESSTLRFALDADSRKTTRVLEEETPDCRRWTDVEPLYRDIERKTTLVRAIIHKGARHQIRVHLAHLGHPICGDVLYGGDNHSTGLYLHHGQISFPGLSASCVPAWEAEVPWNFTE